MAELADFISEERASRKTETERILSLPTDERSPDDDLTDLVELWTARTKTKGGTRKLRPVQALALDVLADIGGLLGAIGVGYGKTLFALLSPRAIDAPASRVLILHPASTRDSLLNEAKKQRHHFQISRRIRILSYTQLSNPGGIDKLRSISPKLIIADEAHYLKEEDSARTKRLSRWFRDNPETNFVPMSGTLTNSSLTDYAHLAEWSLGRLSPVPRTYTELDRWDRVISVDDPTNRPKKWYWRKIQPLVDEYGSGQDLEKIPWAKRKEETREAFQNRFTRSLGVIRTTKSSVDCSLYLKKVDLELPDNVKIAMEEAESDWLLPDGSEIDTPLDKARALKQLSLGCYYVWDWDAVGGVDRDWLYTRREYHKQVRRIIKYGRERLDTPKLVEDAIERGEYGHDEELMDAWKAWQPHKDKDPPPTETKWVTKGAVERIVKRVRRLEEEGRSPLVWCQFSAVMSALQENGLSFAEPGKDDPEKFPGDTPLVVSLHSARRGKNLQQWDTNLMLTPPSSGYVMEQVLGRTHRGGQTSDDVRFEFLAHTEPFRSAILSAKADAQYVYESKGIPQKILYGDWVG